MARAKRLIRWWRNIGSLFVRRTRLFLFVQSGGAVCPR